MECEISSEKTKKEGKIYFKGERNTKQNRHDRKYDENTEYRKYEYNDTDEKERR